jgi:hypothetical protein
MATITVVLGLCGSGKSTFVRQIVGVDVFDEGVAPGWPKHDSFRNALAGGKDCAVVEVAYCMATRRDQFISGILRDHPGTTLNWVCFENDLDAANARCRSDARRTPEQVRGNLEQNQRMSAVYTYPIGSIVLAVTGVGVT